MHAFLASLKLHSVVFRQIFQKHYNKLDLLVSQNIYIYFQHRLVNLKKNQLFFLLYFEIVCDTQHFMWHYEPSLKTNMPSDAQKCRPKSLQNVAKVGLGAAPGGKHLVMVDRRRKWF